ncbi:unnamed protein product [Rotaria sordida]|uniref:PGAP2IP C-terminal nuclease-like domain-containing protein n=2 Tax=Rotaria sordida TaxID=392033 RepID=A0A815G5U9_9BILA|nr:unnamed protein product [Rotaria sordida]
MFKTDLDLHNTYSPDSKTIDHPGRVSSQRYLTAAVWTVHFGYDNNARPSLDRVASVLADTIHYLLPSPEGELAPAILATIQRARKLIYIIIVHMGNDRDDLDRKLQAET